MKRILHIGSFAAVLLLASGCYVLRTSSGGAQASGGDTRTLDVADVALPAGFRIEVVASGLTFPTGAAFDDRGVLHVVESGYAYGEVWTTPRLLRVENGKISVVANGGRNGPWNGVAFHDGAFFVAEGGVLEGGRILRIGRDGSISAIVDGLPSFGDHHTDGPVVSADGWVYFGQGTASNSGIIGEDNAKFGWLKRRPDFHDVPGEDIILAGENFESKDFVRTNSDRQVITGAFVPFGTATRSNQIIKGQTKCSGGVLRVRPDGSELQLVAWGFRNPFGLAFDADGALHATDNGYDERGSRPVWGAPDVLWRVERGTWYGWPDFSAGEPINSKHFEAPWKPRPQFLLARHPNLPPKPVTTFGVHAAATGMDFSRSKKFGHVGQAFVALFGDQAPSVGKTLHAVGFKVVRVDMQRGVVEDFVVNRGRRGGPASALGTGGLERPIAIRFTPNGESMIIVDFGILHENKRGAHPKRGTGVIWRVVREGKGA